MVNYRYLLCRKLGKSPQQLWLAVGAGRGAGQNLLFPGKLLALLNSQSSLAWKGEERGQGHGGGDSHSHHQPGSSSPGTWKAPRSTTASPGMDSSCNLATSPGEKHPPRNGGSEHNQPCSASLLLPNLSNCSQTGGSSCWPQSHPLPVPLEIPFATQSHRKG